MTERKKLIEVALPLEAINRESARERAVLFSSTVDEPSSRSEESPTQEVRDAERERLSRSKEPRTGGIYFVEVKGRIKGADAVRSSPCSTSRISSSWRSSRSDRTTQPRSAYLRRPFAGTKDAYLGVTSVNFDWDTCFALGVTATWPSRQRS